MLAGRLVGKDDAGVFIASCSTPESSFRPARSSNAKKSQASVFRAFSTLGSSIPHLERAKGDEGREIKGGAERVGLKIPAAIHK